MRLDEWQRYIDSEFVETKPTEAGAVNTKDAAATPTDAPSAPVAPDNGADPAGALNAAAPENPAVLGGTSAEPKAMAAEAPVPSIAETSQQPNPPEGALSGDDAVSVHNHRAQEREPSADVTDNRPVRNRFVPKRDTADTGTELNVAPFAEYIAARLEPAVTAPASEADDAPQPEAEASAAPVAAEVEPPAAVQPGTTADRYPLSASRQTLAQLGLIEAGPSTKEEQAARHRKAALVRRLCDPVISYSDTAVLLGVPAGTVAQLAAMGALTPCELAPAKTQTSRRGNPEPAQPGFRLSDIVAFLATNRPAEAE